MREKGGLERSLANYKALETGFSDAETLLELGDELGDPDTLLEAEQALVALVPRVRDAEIEQMFGEKFDDANAILDINSGAGGTDAADWAQMLKRMYLGWAAHMHFKAVVVDEEAHEDAGLKSCRIEVQGPYAYGYLKSEIGVHRLVRISPFDANARRHTAFASVDAIPDIDDDIEIDLKDSDYRKDVFRSGGPGGQSVSQVKNYGKALKILKARLYQHEAERRQAEVDAVNADKKKIEWGSQIRSYVLQPYRMVKDNRTGVESGNTDKVLDGDLIDFMEAWLVQRSGRDDNKASE